MIRIIQIEREPFRSEHFLNAGRGPGNFYADVLPLHTAIADGLPDDLDAIMATADLQGRETFQQAKGQPLRLLGEVLPGLLVSEILPSIGLNDQHRIAVLLAGDFYTVPALDRRGGSGDVTNVWMAFAESFGWVVGVAGNHDLFGSDSRGRLRSQSKMRFIENGTAQVGNLNVGGLSGIIGDPARAWRRTEADFNLEVEILLESNLDAFIMHDGPSGPLTGQRGYDSTQAICASGRPTLIVRGHAHWDDPFCELANGTQILNVDQRVVIIQRDR